MRVQKLMCVLLLAGAGASAQTQKPGLWEISTKTQSDNKEMAAAMATMQKEMAALPPEQRKMMQDMMAKQGMNLEMAPGGAMNLKVCMTPEMVARDQVAPPDEGCTHSFSPRVGNSMKFSFKCTEPVTSGRGEVVFISPEAYRMTMTGSSTESGKTHNISMQTTGRWLGAQCGAIQPMK